MCLYRKRSGAKGAPMAIEQALIDALDFSTLLDRTPARKIRIHSGKNPAGGLMRLLRGHGVLAVVRSDIVQIVWGLPPTMSQAR